ncbi:MAG: hypothetical protein H8D42_04590 [Candidatus Marinimicrobia bacterium]|nr:hypothetical protein [Candidatus Neomarinimicrobiota bacterium]MBL7066422.1 hypothetical protein [Candidatus Neomarinimicrobiota bacterium]
MKWKTHLLFSLVLIFSVLIFINGCSENSVSNPSEPVESIGIHMDDIQWVSAKPEFVSQLKALKKSVIDGKLISVAEGGTVGGENTYNNSVVFPPGAFNEDTYVTVEVEYNKNGIVWVEFLPSGSFNEFVEATLSWEHLDIDELLIADLNIYFSQDDGEYWFNLDSEPVINYENKTVTYKTNHFTRYGWGI